MGKPGKWFKTFLTGKKDKEKEKDSTKCIENPLTTPNLITPSTPKEKKRWSFRRSSATPKELNSAEPSVTATLPVALLDSEDEQKKHDQAMAAATAAATDAAAQVAAAVVRLTEAVKERNSAIEDAAATKIQSVFRSYLARKALCALKGLVKLQALVRGHLVRKQAATTLRCMQALVNVQARARAHRISSVDDANTQRLSVHKKMTQGSRFRHTNYESDGGMEDNIKIVEMDLGGSKGSTRSRNIYSHNSQSERAEHHRLSTHYASTRTFSKQDNSQISPAPSALTEMSPRTYSGHFDFEDCGFGTAQSSPQYGSARSKPDPSKVPFAFPRSECAEPLSYDYPFFPSYMANTQSSRAKVRSHSAPKQRPDSFERQPSTGRRRASIEGRNVPRAVRMQRTSSHVGATAQNYKYPWAVKLDRSSVSLKESECGSTSTVLTNTNYSRSLVGYDVHGNRY